LTFMPSDPEEALGPGARGMDVQKRLPEKTGGRDREKKKRFRPEKPERGGGTSEKGERLMVKASPAK